MKKKVDIKRIRVIFQLDEMDDGSVCIVATMSFFYMKRSDLLKREKELFLYI